MEQAAPRTYKIVNVTLTGLAVSRLSAVTLFVLAVLVAGSAVARPAAELFARSGLGSANGKRNRHEGGNKHFQQ